jgi:hypothetical protein
MLVVQEIETVWTKQSRGAPGAVARNAVPDRLRFTPPPGRVEGLEHLAVYLEKDGFVVRESLRSIDAEAALQYGCVRLVGDLNRLGAFWQYDPGIAGAPKRKSTAKEIFDLTVGQWGSVRYNGRMVDYGGWWYRQVVLNVGIFASVTGDEFLARKPDCIYDRWRALRKNRRRSLESTENPLPRS